MFFSVSLLQVIQTRREALLVRRGQVLSVVMRNADERLSLKKVTLFCVFEVFS